MQKFSREVVLDQVSDVQNGELSRHESQVYEAWSNLAEEWLASGNHAESGFRGFDDRTPEQILIDFSMNDLLLDPLSEDELFKLLGNQAGVGNGTE